jgi:fatty acyl-CoA reductase
VNGQRQGVVQEKPFCLGDSIANEILLCSTGSSEHAAGAVLDIEAEIKLAFDHRTKPDDSASSCIQEMKDLGLKKVQSPVRLLCIDRVVYTSGCSGTEHRHDVGLHVYMFGSCMLFVI